jgi:hypothetical protein
MSGKLLQVQPKTHNRYPDLVLFSSFTVTIGYSSVYRDWQKTRHRDADGNSLNRRAVRCHSARNQDIINIGYNILT